MVIIKKSNLRSAKRNYHFLFFILLILYCFNTTGCVLFKKKPPSDVKVNPLIKLQPEQYPKFSDDLFYDGLQNSIRQSITFFKKMPLTKKFTFGQESYTTEDMLQSLTVFNTFIQNEPSTETLNTFIRENFAVYKSIGSTETANVLFTGYYEPSLSGSLEKKGKYQFPVFAMPENLVTINLRQFSDRKSFKRSITGRYTGKNTVVPYYTRKEIGNGDVLMKHAKVLAYVDSAVDLFFLEIQGSGIIFLDNGNTIRVHYHAKNGHAYKSIGAYLVKYKNIPLEEMSMQRIRQYLDEHPDEIKSIFNYNTSYVFFKLEQGGPYGCYNAEVTPGRSIATDKKMFPACGLAFIQTQKPVIDGDAAISSWINFGRFVLNQDTGGAIKGPGRADIFKGNGEYAEIAAGHTQHRGDMFFLVLKKSDVTNK